MATSIASGPTVARTTSDQAFTGTSLQTITDLSFPMTPNEECLFYCIIPFNLAGILSGFKFGLSGPAAMTTTMVVADPRSSNVLVTLLPTVVGALGTLVSGALGASGDHFCYMVGFLKNGANAGTMQFQVAQNVNNAGQPITTKEGSSVFKLALN